MTWAEAVRLAIGLGQLDRKKRTVVGIRQPDGGWRYYISTRWRRR